MYSKKTMKSAIESMMFVWGEPLTISEAAEIFDEDKNTVRDIFEDLAAEYEDEERGIRIREIDGAFQYVTYIENDIFIEKLCTPVKIKRLSQAALEVLAVVAYRQPVTRGEIDSIRGIKSDRVLDGLMNKGLIEGIGRSEGVGRPLLYGTTEEFLKKFGFKTLKDMPVIDEFEDERGKEGNGTELHEQISLEFETNENK